MVPGSCASGIADGMTAPHPVDCGASLTGLAAGWLAHHDAQLGITTTAKAAVLFGPKHLFRLIVEAVIGAATALYGDAFVGAEDVAVVALAGFHTRVAAGRRSRSVRAAGWTGIPTGLVMAVLRTRQSWQETATYQ